MGVLAPALKRKRITDRQYNLRGIRDHNSDCSVHITNTLAGLCETLSSLVERVREKFGTLLDLCVSSLRRGHANLLCIVPILTDDPREESTERIK